MNYIGEKAIKKLISLIKGDLATKQDSIAATGVLERDTTGVINGVETVGATLVETQEATLVDVPNGLLKGDGTTISAAAAGTDYVNSSQAIRYDAAQTLTDAQKTQALENIAAAPAGYGLGESHGRGLSNASLNSLINNGWYFLYRDNTDGPDNVNINDAILFVSSASSDLTKVQRLILGTAGMQGYELMRVYNNNSWLPWEWVNPPMQPGFEYRTTERYRGKPVYAKHIFCESMPSGAGYIDIQPSNTEVPNALISTAITIRCYGRSSVKATIPFFTNSGDFIQVGVVENCKIRIYTAKAYGGTADITVHYVKSTD